MHFNPKITHFSFQENQIKEKFKLTTLCTKIGFETLLVVIVLLRVFFFL